jgi:UDP-N-acetylmuramate--alanine ligase
MSEAATIDLGGVRRVHIVGIGGAGMSAIARVLVGWGLQVQGSDRRASPLTAALQTESIAVAVGHSAENVGQVDLVLASSAVPDDNVELVAARERGLAVVRRPEFLGPLTSEHDVVAVAGAHGKTTVTGMITLVLLEAGLDPTFIVGGVVAELDTNARAGTGRYFVIEADEYRETFLALHPAVAVITNVEFDHPDCFEDFQHLRLAFGEFADNVVPGGLLIVCAEDPVAYEIAMSHHANGGRVALYGSNRETELAWRAKDLIANVQGGVSFTVEYEGQPLGEIALQVPGEFNALNALAALCVGAELGIDWQVMSVALARFSGTARRFEILGEVDGVTVIDDYAHHPTQIRGVLEAARTRYPGRRIVAVWEPHTFSRVRALHEAFTTSFKAADRVVLLPIYAAREPDDGTLTSEALARAVEHPHVASAPSLEAVVGHLAATSRSGDVVLMLGAGNETLAGERLLAELRARGVQGTARDATQTRGC